METIKQYYVVYGKKPNLISKYSQDKEEAIKDAIAFDAAGKPNVRIIEKVTETTRNVIWADGAICNGC